MNPKLVPVSSLARSVLRTQSDERLVELTRSGSDAAFEALVARFRRPLLRHCARIVGDADAEEAVQDALLRAHAALLRGASVHNVRAWLYVIAHNAALRILRVRDGRNECLHNGHEPSEAHDTTSEQREQLRDLVSALHSLPQRQRDAIVLRELDGLSYEQIAARLGTSDGAVRQLLYRARDAVRDRLGAITGIEPLLRFALSSGGGAGGSVGAVTRLGALSGGCALTMKLCGVALIPGVVSGVAGSTHQPAARARTASARASTTTKPRRPPTTVTVAAAQTSTTTRTPYRAAPATPLTTAATTTSPPRRSPTSDNLSHTRIDVVATKQPPSTPRTTPSTPAPTPVHADATLSSNRPAPSPGSGPPSPGASAPGGGGLAAPVGPSTVPRQQGSEERSPQP
jgi:RNA polymerase sigma factor (sigma-70 family)